MTNKLEMLEKSLDSALEDYITWTEIKADELKSHASDDIHTAFIDMRDSTAGLFRTFKEEIIKYLDTL